MELVKQSNVDISTVLDTFSKDLACLAPQTGVVADVSKALEAGRTADEVITIIRVRPFPLIIGSLHRPAQLICSLRLPLLFWNSQNECDSKVDVSFLAPIVTAHIFQHAFADKAALNLEPVDKYAALIKLVASTKASQMDALVAAHSTWFATGMVKGGIKSLYEKLFSAKLITAEAFVAWRDDLVTKKAPGKQQALLNVSGFLSEVVEPSMRQPRSADDDEDDEDVDDDIDAEYLVNHNR